MQHRQHMMSAAAHSGLECDATEQHDVKCVWFWDWSSGVMCDGVGEGGKQSSKSIQECFRGTNL